LEDRIKQIRAEADAFIDAAMQLSAETPNVPLQLLRNLLTTRANGCHCQAYLNLNN
jgi:hypothetical protein